MTTVLVTVKGLASYDAVSAEFARLAPDAAFFYCPWSWRHSEPGWLKFTGLASEDPGDFAHDIARECPVHVDATVLGVTRIVLHPRGEETDRG